MARALAGWRALPGGGELFEAQILCARDAALSKRRAAHRAHSELFDRRCAGALYVDAWLQRAASDGLGCVRAAGRECGNQEPDAAARVDAFQYRKNEAHAPSLRVFL